MVAPDALTGPGGVVLQEDTDIEPFNRWAEAGKPKDGQLWMQMSHDEAALNKSGLTLSTATQSRRITSIQRFSEGDE